MRASSGRWPEHVRRYVGVGVVMVAFVVYWWWPGLNGEGSGTDVVIQATREFSRGRESFERRMREEGWRVDWDDSSIDWCDLAGTVSRADVRADSLVIWGPEEVACDTPADIAAEILAAAGSRDLLVVQTSPNAVIDVLSIGGATVIDGRTIVGEPGDAKDCLWWEECPPAGRIEPWTSDGLSLVGYERIARVTVAALR